MISDGRGVPDGSLIEADLCIVGGGPAGITIARALAGTALQVCLLESGGEAPDDATRELSRGENIGRPYYALDETRTRALGGSSNLWGGWCRPLDPIDFEPRAWVAHSGWPLRFADLERYYEQAAEVCQLERSDFALSHWDGVLPAVYRPPFVAGDVHAAVWQGSPPTKFGVAYRAELKQAANVQVLLHANVVECAVAPSGERVTAAQVACIDGPRFEVRAKAFVLTAGAIETARLLLASTGANPAGLGNDRDLVGRFFMEHPHVVSGRVRIQPRSRSHRPLIPAVDRGVRGARSRVALQRPSGNLKCAYTLSAEAQRTHQLLNFSTHLTTGGSRREENTEAYRALKLVLGNLRSPRQLASQIRHRRLPEGVGRQLRSLVSNLDQVVRILRDEVARRPTHLELYTQSEQSPNPDSRVTLGPERDRLGMPRVRLDWRLSDLDKRSLRHAQALVGARLQAAGLGALEPAVWVERDDDEWGSTLQGGHHHMGTARMGRQPSEGVVDPNCRVHGVENLYVSDGAVFPTVGYANPLLTIVALALRTADHLRSDLAR
jgi:choline dehydrogenase-like flavoprotein